MKSTFIFDLFGRSAPASGAGFGALPETNFLLNHEWTRMNTNSGKRRATDLPREIGSACHRLSIKIIYLTGSILFGSQQSTIDYQLLPSTPADCFQIADAAVTENDQIPVAVNVCRLDEPGPAGKFIGAHGFVIECHRVVIDADILRLPVTWISHAVLNRRANPRPLRWTKWRERTNPAPGIILEAVVAAVS